MSDVGSSVRTGTPLEITVSAWRAESTRRHVEKPASRRQRSPLATVRFATPTRRIPGTGVPSCSAIARAEDPAKQSGNKQNKEPKTNNGKKPDDGGEDSQKGLQNPQDGKGDASRKDGQKGSDNDKKGAGKGDLSTLPDNEQLVPMTVQETRQLLEEWTERMRQERQARQRMMVPPAGRVKDW